MNLELTNDVHIVLVACVKSKAPQPAAAKDLYVSTLFRKARAYAEHSGVPWFILSAENGLVAPGRMAERYLGETSASYRSAWGEWVVARLELLVGPLSGKVIEIHAGRAYLGTIRPFIESLGARVVDPLHGLSIGQRLAYTDRSVKNKPGRPVTLPNSSKPFATLRLPFHSKNSPLEARPALTDHAAVGVLS